MTFQQAILTCLRKYFTFSGCAALLLPVVLVSMISASRLAYANENAQAAVETAMDFCLDLPSSTDDARAYLLPRGFSEQTDDTATLRILASAALATRFDLGRFEETFADAMFGAVSTLGNSSLGKDQPAFSNDQIELATLGLNEGTPLCILAGPLEYLLPATGGTRTIAYSAYEEHAMGFGYEAGHLFLWARFDQASLRTALEDSKDPADLDGFQEQLSLFPPEMVLQIIPTSTLEAQ